MMNFVVVVARRMKKIRREREVKFPRPVHWLLNIALPDARFPTPIPNVAMPLIDPCGVTVMRPFWDRLVPPRVVPTNASVASMIGVAVAAAANWNDLLGIFLWIYVVAKHHVVGSFATRRGIVPNGRGQRDASGSGRDLYVLAAAAVENHVMMMMMGGANELLRGSRDERGPSFWIPRIILDPRRTTNGMCLVLVGMPIVGPW
mmetsp:Transcript_54/g.94  ORF Transcript_54/g.94 Transcript_54/m.94 type:complete len:203 (+) Transcript_54:777-1385(+)